VTPQGESRAATAHDAAPAAGRTRRSADRVRAATEALFARAVRGRSDAQLDRIVGSPAALRLLFRGMEQSYSPGAGPKVHGEIEYELLGRRGPQRWTLRLDDSQATARPGG